MIYYCYQIITRMKKPFQFASFSLSSQKVCILLYRYGLLLSCNSITTGLNTAARRRYLSLSSIKGLCADVGALQRLPKLIGSQSLVRELCFTARKVDSQEANQCGLVSKVCHDKERYELKLYIKT